MSSLTRPIIPVTIEQTVRLSVNEKHPQRSRQMGVAERKTGPLVRDSL